MNRKRAPPFFRNSLSNYGTTKKNKRGALFISSRETPPLIDKANYSLVNRYASASMDVECRILWDVWQV
jgi:hypothetical protein